MLAASWVVVPAACRTASGRLGANTTSGTFLARLGPVGRRVMGWLVTGQVLELRTLARSLPRARGSGRCRLAAVGASAVTNAVRAVLGFHRPEPLALLRTRHPSAFVVNPALPRRPRILLLQPLHHGCAPGWHRAWRESERHGSRSPCTGFVPPRRWKPRSTDRHRSRATRRGNRRQRRLRGDSAATTDALNAEGIDAPTDRRRDRRSELHDARPTFREVARRRADLRRPARALPRRSDRSPRMSTC